MVSCRFSPPLQPCTDPKDKGAAKADGQTVDAWNFPDFPDDPRSGIR